MRLRRLDLTRYGRFTDHSIDFGAADPGQPDLHIVYGPNEAGKSTTLAAFLDLLFGIETRSRYNFRHPYNTMRIGAVLETATGPRAFVRLKRAQASLFDGDDLAMPDGSLLGELVGLDRGAYQAMFCLDDDTLEAGGRSILESRGELGRLLFAASSGLAALSQRLADLRDEADLFYRFHGRGGELARLKGELATLKDERERLDTVASEYHRLVERRDADHALYQAAQAARGQTQARIDTIQSQLAALPHVIALQGLRDELAGLADAPIPPAAWSDDLPRLHDDDVKLTTQAATLDVQIARQAAQVDAIVVDAVAAGLASRVADLAKLRARHVTADLDIPDRRRERLAVDSAIATLLDRLERPGEPDPGRLLIPVRLATLFAKLIAARSGITATLATALREHAAAKQAFTAARQALAEAGGGDAAADGRLRRVALAAKALRDSDHRVRRRTAERAREAAEIKLEGQLAALRPWVGTAADLSAMTVPDASVVEGWRKTLDVALRDEATHSENLIKLDADILRLDAELEAMAALLGVVSDQEVAGIRTAREAAWSAHRLRLEPETADSFEAALRRDDLVTAARLGHQTDLAKSREIARTRAVQAAEHQRIGALLRTCVTQRDALAKDIAAAIAVGMAGLPPAMQPDALKTWLAQRAAALETWRAERQADSDMRSADQDAATLREALWDALAKASVPCRSDAEAAALLDAAEASLAGDQERIALRNAAANAETALTKRADALDGATIADLTWRKQWSEACAACWLGETGGAPEPEDVEGVLTALKDLGSLIQQQRDLAGRIAAMTEDQVQYATAIGAIALSLGIDGTAPPLDLARQVEARVQAAQAAMQERRTAEAALTESREQRRVLADREALHAARKSAMLAFFAVASLDDVATRLREAARRTELEALAHAAETALAQALGGPAGEETKAELARLSREVTQAELQGLRIELAHLDGQTRDLYARSRQSAEHIEAIGGDDAVARIEVRRRTALLEVEQRASAYLRLRAGILAAEMALSRYRDRHRSAMMARASAAFATISQGVYEKLTSRPEKDGEVLIAVGADGTSKLADDLSKGTRFQLYLALRAAGYQEFAAMHRPVPFIADDIMETFDDFRAEETFRVLGEMANVGQVIYLTHHRHLTEIGRRIVPAARVHTLGT